MFVREKVAWGHRYLCLVESVREGQRVGFGGMIAQRLEGVAPVAEIARPVRQGLELVRLHLAAILRFLQVAHLRDDAVDGPVEAAHPGVEAVDDMLTTYATLTRLKDH